MDVLKIPFNSLIGLTRVDNEKDYIFKLTEKREYQNHLGSVHASALFALAEATSGEYLKRLLGETKLNIIPVVRRVELKYNRAAYGEIFSRATLLASTKDDIINELQIRKRTTLKIFVELCTNNNAKVFSSVFEWYLNIITQ